MSFSAVRSRAIHRTLSMARRTYAALYMRRHPELAAIVADIRSRKPQSLGVGAADFSALCSHILRRRPRHVLDLGAGQSSAVMAFALEQIGGGELVAVEESEMWFNQHRATLPPAMLAKMVLLHRPAEETDVDGRRAIHFLDLPRAPYEMIHVDGPTPKAVGADVSSDVLDLLPSLGERCLIVFDGREDTARMVRPYLERAGFKTSRHPFTWSYEFSRG